MSFERICLAFGSSAHVSLPAGTAAGFEQAEKKGPESAPACELGVQRQLIVFVSYGFISVYRDTCPPPPRRFGSVGIGLSGHAKRQLELLSRHIAINSSGAVPTIGVRLQLNYVTAVLVDVTVVGSE